MLRCALPARPPFQALQRPQQFRGGEHVKRQLTQPVQGPIELVEDLDDLFATAATHASNSTKGHRNLEPSDVTTETKVAQGITGLSARAFGKSRVKQVTDAMAFPQVQQIRQHLQRRTHAFVILDARVHAIGRG